MQTTRPRSQLQELFFIGEREFTLGHSLEDQFPEDGNGTGDLYPWRPKMYETVGAGGIQISYDVWVEE